MEVADFDRAVMAATLRVATLGDEIHLVPVPDSLALDDAFVYIASRGTVGGANPGPIAYVSDGSVVRAYCSLPCKAGASKGTVPCDVCQTPFTLTSEAVSPSTLPSRINAYRAVGVSVVLPIPCGTHAACMKKCMDKGAKMVVVTDDDKKVLEVENPDALKGHEGHHVTVTGKVTGSMVHVDSVKMM